MPDSLRLENVGFSYRGAAVLSDVSLSVPKGGMRAIAGRSGCGKTTLLEICSSQKRPQAGAVRWDDVDVASLPRAELMRRRQGIGFVFQRHALIHNFTVFDNVALPLRYHGRMAEREVRRTVASCMDALGLVGVDKKFPNELSAAQSRCAAIARAIVMEPSLLFLDEPTAGIDPLTAKGIATVLKSMNESRGLTVVAACNDIELLKTLSCPVAVLEGGALRDYRDEAAPVGGGSMFSVLRESL
jgi:phospholipid/cholesterol/gamma-HCH transport system ATP-binding protein